MKKRGKKSKVYQYNSKEELIGELEKLRQMFESPKGKLEYELDEVARNSVAPNTFRAFGGCKRKPSEVFREWASKTLNDSRFLENLIKIDDESKFDEWHTELCDSFMQHWKVSMTKDIGFGPSRKLPDLLLRVLVFNRNILPERDKARLMKFLHVPLDRFVLQAIKNVINHKNIKNLTMTGIDNSNKYNQIQQTIREISKKAKTPPIYLDILAWDKMH